MDFSNFFVPYVFDVDESVFRSFTHPFCSGDLENLSRLPVLHELQATDDWAFTSFRNFIIPYVLEVKKSVSSQYHDATMFG